jgi:hypothetical protein
MTSCAAPKAVPRASQSAPLLFPEKIPAERWIALCLFVIACLYLCAFRRFMLLDPDEGIVLQGAERILQGEVLYRDFFSFLTPGSYYWLALLFKVFGNYLIVARTVLVIYGGIFAVFAYLVARRVCCRWVSLLIAYLTIITSLSWRFVVLHNWDSTVLLCLSLYCAILFVQSRRLACTFATGTLASLAFLFEQSKGAGLVLGLLMAFALLAWLKPPVGFELRHGFALAAGLAWPLVITLVYFASHRALGAMLADWDWAFHHYAVTNNVPYGYADWSDEARQSLFGTLNSFGALLAIVTVSPCFLLPVLPIIGLVLLICWVIRARRGLMDEQRFIYFMIAGCSIFGALLSVVFVRKNVIHFAYLTPVFYLVLAWVIEGRDIGGTLVRSLRPVVAFGVFMTFSAMGMTLLIANRNAHSVIETRRGAVRVVWPDQVIRYTQGHVSPGEKIFVYPYLPLVYYLTATFSATRFEYLQPGMHTRQQAEEAIAELETKQTAIVLFESSFYDKISTSWPNTPLAAIAVDPVADYIFGHYHRCATLTAGAKSSFAFMLRDGIPCSPGAKRQSGLTLRSG